MILARPFVTGLSRLHAFPAVLGRCHHVYRSIAIEIPRTINTC